MKHKSHYMVRDRWTTRAVEWVLFTLARGVRVLTLPVPVWRLTGALAPLGGVLAWYLPGPRRRAMQNLDLIWPELDPARKREITRQAGQHFMRLAVEYSRLDDLMKDLQFKVHGAEHLEGTKGAVLVTAHFGNWEAARMAAKQLGHETGIIYRAFNNRYLDRYTLNLIPLAGAPVLQKGREGMRALIGHVRKGGKIMILVDQRNSGAPFLDFMGQPAETVTVAAELARKTGAALIPVRAERNLQTRGFDVTFEPAIPATDPDTMMQAVNDRIADWIRETPEQWFWFHRRWRSTYRSRQQ